MHLWPDAQMHLWPDAQMYPVSTTQSHQESGSTDISNIISAAFDFQQIGYPLQTNRTINTQDRSSFMLVATLLCLKERRGLHAHFYVKPPEFDLEEVVQGQICHHKEICNLWFPKGLQNSGTNNKQDIGTIC